LKVNLHSFNCLWWCFNTVSFYSAKYFILLILIDNMFVFSEQKTNMKNHGKTFASILLLLVVKTSLAAGKLTVQYL